MNAARAFAASPVGESAWRTRRRRNPAGAPGVRPGARRRRCCRGRRVRRFAARPASAGATSRTPRRRRAASARSRECRIRRSRRDRCGAFARRCIAKGSGPAASSRDYGAHRPTRRELERLTPSPRAGRAILVLGASTRFRMSAIDYQQLAADIRQWGTELGFGRIGIAGTELDEDEAHLLQLARLPAITARWTTWRATAPSAADRMISRPARCA